MLWLARLSSVTVLAPVLMILVGDAGMGAGQYPWPKGTRQVVTSLICTRASRTPSAFSLATTTLGLVVRGLTMTCPLSSPELVIGRRSLWWNPRARRRRVPPARWRSGKAWLKTTVAERTHGATRVFSLLPSLLTGKYQLRRRLADVAAEMTATMPSSIKVLGSGTAVMS